MEGTPNALSSFKSKIVPHLKTLYEICGIYLFWILIHYICSHLYVTVCTPLTIVGFFMTPFVVSAPHCQAIRWGILTGSASITAMWVTLGTWIAKKFVL
jgi:hypothetical protein